MKLIVEEEIIIKRQLTLEEWALVELQTVNKLVGTYKQTDLIRCVNDKLTEIGFKFVNNNTNLKHTGANIGTFVQTVKREAKREEVMAWHYLKMRELCHENDDYVCRESCPLNKSKSCGNETNEIACKKLLEGKNIIVVIE